MYLSKRKGTYYIFYARPNGKLTCKSTKEKNKAAALRYLSTFQQRLKEQAEAKTIPIAINDFKFFFLKNFEPTHTVKTIKGYKVTFKYLAAYLGNIQLSDISAIKIRSYFEQRISSSSVFQARKDLINLNCAFNWAIKAGYLNHNPCSSIKRYKLPEKQPMYFTVQGFNQLLQKITQQDMRDLVIFAVNTGLRQMELIKLQWSQVNSESRLLILDNHEHLTKGKKVRSIPINRAALEVLKGRLLKDPERSRPVFTYNNKELTQSLVSHKFKKYVLAASENPKLNFHSLRHTFASWLIQKGAPIYEVSKLLGHRDIKTTEIYSHLKPDDLRRSVDLLDE